MFQLFLSYNLNKKLETKILLGKDKKRGEGTRMLMGSEGEGGGESRNLKCGEDLWV